MADRLERLMAQAQQRGDALATRIAQIQQQNAQRQDERLANTVSHVPASARGAVEQAHQEAQERQCAGEAKGKGCPKPRGTP